MEYLWQMQAHTYIQLTIFFTRVDPDSAGVIDWPHELHLGNLFDLTVSETIETLGSVYTTAKKPMLRNFEGQLGNYKGMLF